MLTFFSRLLLEAHSVVATWEFGTACLNLQIFEIKLKICKFLCITSLECNMLVIKMFLTAQAKQNSYVSCICFATPVLEQQNI